MDRIDRYRLFLRIAECGSFSLAAEQLGLPRPTVSSALQQLEAQLGTRLLHRTTRRVSLTPDGQALLERVRGLLDEVDEMEQRFRSTDARIGGRLRVDVPGRIARRLVAPQLPALLQQHPELTVELGSNDRIVDLVREGIDCALRVGQPGPGSVVARRLGQFELINCASPAYLQRHGTPEHPGDLAQHWTVHLLTSGIPGSDAWEWREDGREDGRDHRLQMPSRASADDVGCCIALALAGAGLIQLPAFDVRDALDRGELVEVMPRHRPAPMPVHVVYPHRRHLSRRVQSFVAWIEGLLRPHLQDTGGAVDASGSLGALENRQG